MRAGILGIVLAAGLACGVPASASEVKTLSTNAPSDQPTLEQRTAVAVAHAFGMETAVDRIAGNLELLAHPPKLPSQSKLKVMSIKPGFLPGTWFLRVGCSSSNCMPFEAVLRMRSDDPAVHLRQAELAVPASVVISRHPDPASAIVRTGDHVQLVEEFSGMRLRVNAVCLEAGAMGDRIRVRNLATHVPVVAKVMSQGEVRVGVE